MQAIISFNLKGGINQVPLPFGARIIKMTLKKFAEKGFGPDYIIRQQEAIALVGWAIVDPDKLYNPPEPPAEPVPYECEKRTLIVVGTNKPVPPSAEYIDSIMFEDEKLAMHLFEVKA